MLRLRLKARPGTRTPRAFARNAQPEAIELALRNAVKAGFVNKFKHPRRARTTVNPS